MSKVTINIPNWRPATLNSMSSSNHWAKRAKLKKIDRQMVAAYASGLPKAEGKRKVTIEISHGKGQRMCDPDAFYKSTLDALVHCGMLVDDSDKYVKLGDVEQHRANKHIKKAGTIITLEDIEND